MLNIQKNKNGFTLVELLAVIVVMAIIAAIGYASVSGVIGSSKEKLYDQQVFQIIKAAKQWSIENINQLSSKTYVTLEDLKASGNLSEIPENPKTGKLMGGCVIIELAVTSSNYNYSYSEVFYGDVNLDGKVDNSDYDLLFNLMGSNNINSLTSIQKKAVDVNLDGNLTDLDAIIIERHVAGFKGYETLPYYSN